MTAPPTPAETLRLAGSARGDRWTITRAVADAVGEVGYVTQSTAFGGSALAVFATVRAGELSGLGPLLGQAGVRLDASSLEVLGESVARASIHDDVLASIVVTFSDATGDDRVEVPHVPG